MNLKKSARKIIPKNVISVSEETYRRSRAYAMQLGYGFPSHGQKIIGVTGTNGKTTSCNYINGVLKAAGFRTALYTTAVIEMDGEYKPNTTHRTLPPIAVLLKFLKTAKKLKVDYVIIEATSQGLQQHKLLGIRVDVAVFTNLTNEHLDYHKTMENYAAAKAMLFNENMKPAYSVLNSDDEYFKYFSDQSYGKVVSYGKSKDSTYHIQNLRLQKGGTKWDIKDLSGSTEMSINQVGEFNAYNASAAVATGRVLGISYKKIAKGILNTETVPGRMETLKSDKDFQVIIDYAHTRDAVEKVLTAARGITKGRLICISGAAGERPLERRAPVGKVATELSDIFIVTDDEPYGEDPNEIRKQVLSGTKNIKNGAKVIEIPDRCQAMKESFKMAKEGDVIVIVGFGRQASRFGMKGEEPWDDYLVAKDMLEGRPNKFCENWHKLYPPKA